MKSVAENRTVRGVRYRKWLWHGVGGQAAWDRICAGEGLRLPSVHSHDVGDYGYGVYFTDSVVRARTYSRPLPDGRIPLVHAQVSFENALLINWRQGSGNAMDPKHPAWGIIAWLRESFGDPLHGGDEARARASREWRSGLLAQGVDGIVVLHSLDTEVVVYDPRRSIRTYKCRIGEPR